MNEAPSSANWMRALASHYSLMRSAYPDDVLCIVFDIDGTILDSRYLIADAFYRFDAEHASDYFAQLRPTDILAHETDVGPLLDEWALPEVARNEALAWYRDQIWSVDASPDAHHPFPGVMGAIRWFQLQDRTVVAVNTDRPERFREQTVAALNRVAAPYRVSFDEDLVCMNEQDWETGVPEGKVRGIERLRNLGLRVFAAIDNEPENLHAMAKADTSAEILFLHADTIFKSPRQRLARAVSGTDYDLRHLIGEHDLSQRVQFVWHGANDRPNLQQFLASDVHWAELDIRRDRAGRLALRHDPFGGPEKDPSEAPLLAAEAFASLRERDRSIKVDLKESGETLHDVLALVAESGIPDEALWFNGTLQTLGREGVQSLASAHAGATISCPADFMIPLIGTLPEAAASVSSGLRELGVTRLSLRWPLEHPDDTLDRLDELGWEVNLWDLPDLTSFLEAALLLPRSVTADFNFPEWNYFGRGSGQAGARHEYALELSSISED